MGPGTMLETEFAVRAEAHQVETIRIGLAVDQKEVGAHVTVAVVLPPTGQLVVVMSSGQCAVRCRIVEDARQFGVQIPGEPPSLFSFVVPLEGSRPPNRPH